MRFAAYNDLVLRARGVFYGWRLVGIAIFMLTMVGLTAFQGMGIYVVTLERHFGWSRTVLSGAFSLARAEGALLGPIEGFLVDRFGTRRMVLIGLTILAIGFLLFSQVNSVWNFYLAFMVITVGAGVGGFLPMMAAINNWFIRKRTLAMAIAMSGGHFGGFLVPLLALSIESQGFRITTFGIGVFLLAFVVPGYRLIRNRPEEYGLLPDGDPPPSMAEATIPNSVPPKVDSEPQFTVRQAVLTPAFWLITISNVSSSVSITVLAVHLVPRLTDIGLEPVTAGLIVLMVSAIALPSQYVAGYVGDRLPKPPVIFVLLVLQATSVLVLALAENIYWAFMFAVLYGIGFGGRIPLMTAIRGDFFGRKAFATISGISQFPSNLATIGALIFAGYMFDTTGSYFVPFIIFALLNYLGALLMLVVRRPKAARSA